MTVDPRTPVVVGVGQHAERLGEVAYLGLGPADIAAAAARAACEDAFGALGLDRLRDAIDAVATTRTFDDSREARPLWGTSSNFPRSVARRLGLAPRLAVWAKVGGDTPQTLVADLGERIFRGEVGMALLAGGEAISTARAAARDGRTLDWSEAPDGDVEDHGKGTEGLITAYNQRHGLVGAPLSYGLLEHARRHRLGRSRRDHAHDMAALFAPFTAVAAAHPHAAFVHPPRSAAELAADTPRNRLIADPYRLSMVAKDQVNQGAALLLTSVGRARALGIPEHRWCYLHGHAQGNEAEIMERLDLGHAPVAQAVARAALAQAGVDVAGCGHFDFYSCFPVAVANIACDALGLAADDPRGLTVTGGLPFFGGPGNNYSMHAIATMVERLRRRPGERGLVVANGGYLSKHASGVYGCRAAPWPGAQRVDAPAGSRRSPPVWPGEGGSAVIESFTLSFDGGVPAHGLVAARLAGPDRRVLAVATPQALAVLADPDVEPIGRPVDLRPTDRCNVFALPT